MKIAYLFPGQGSQYENMGKDFYEQYPEAREVYEKAEEILGCDIKKICFDKEEQKKHTQIAIYVTEVAMLKVIEKRVGKAEFAAGLSLGEYAALTSSRVFSFETGLKTIAKREEYMNQWIELGDYQMAAVIGLEDDKVKEVCDKIEGFIVPVNYNCPGQVVVSGKKEIVEKAKESFLQEGARKVIPLAVSSAFHTEKLEKAKEKLYEYLEEVEFGKMEGTVIKNLDAKPYTEEDNKKEILANHIVSPVYFGKSVQEMIRQGVTSFIEIGPGKTLAGFVKKVDPTVEIVSIGKVEDLKKWEEKI